MKQRLIALLLAMCFTVMLLAPAPGTWAFGTLTTNTDLSPVVPTEATSTVVPTVSVETTIEPQSTVALPSPTIESTVPPPTDASTTPAQAFATPEATLGLPSVCPSVEPTTEPDAIFTEPTAIPTAEPTVQLTAEPTAEPTLNPSVDPTIEITAEPTAELTAEPTLTPSVDPTMEITAEPTLELTAEPTLTPSVDPTMEITAEPTVELTAEPTIELTIEPTAEPTAEPSPTVLPLQVTLTCDARYAFAHEDTLALPVTITGGVAPFQLQLTILCDDVPVAEQYLSFDTEGSYRLTYAPDHFGNHSFLLSTTDAVGSSFTSRIAIPVAIHAPEFSSDWVQSTRDAILTGDWRTDLVAVARTQIGYAESSKDFIIDNNGIQHGYTRYGSWYGAAYSDWCSMFISFCLHFANIPASGVPQQAHCGLWQEIIREKGAYRTPADGYMPQPGDLVFFSWDDEDEAEHIGIVEAIYGNTLQTIEGNVSARVCRKEYSLNNKAIVGYANMTRLMEKAGLLRESVETLAANLPDGALGKGYTLVGSVNVRSNPTTESSRVAIVKKTNTAVILLGYEYTGTKLWYKVQYDGATGFIRSDLLETVLLAPLVTPQPAVQPEPEPTQGPALEPMTEPTPEAAVCRCYDMNDDLICTDPCSCDCHTEIFFPIKPEPMVIAVQPQSLSWTPDITSITLTCEVLYAEKYHWEQGTFDECGDIQWTVIGNQSTLTLTPSLETLRCLYRCVAYDSQGATLSSDSVTLLPDAYLEWLHSATVTEPMLLRAISAGGLDLLVLENNTLVHVRSGDIIARYDASIGYFVDCATGLIVAYIDPATGALCPVVTQADTLLQSGGI